jgi:hypothetical protein
MFVKRILLKCYTCVVRVLSIYILVFEFEIVICNIWSLKINIDVGISKSVRDIPPSDYLFKIHSYSLLMDTKVEKYESNDFQVGEHKWLVLFSPPIFVKLFGQLTDVYCRVKAFLCTDFF